MSERIGMATERLITAHLWSHGSDPRYGWLPLLAVVGGMPSSPTILLDWIWSFKKGGRTRVRPGFYKIEKRLVDKTRSDRQ